jgi:hypothetical protein
MGSAMTVFEAVFSDIFLGFITYEIIHKLFKVPQPLPALALILIYSALYMFVINRFIYTPEKGGLFTHLLGYHAIPFNAVLILTLIALAVLYFQKEIGILALCISLASILYFAWESVKEYNRARDMAGQRYTILKSYV